MTRRTLISPERIRARVAELGEELSLFYEGRELTMVILMNGALFFGADLARAIRAPLRLDSIAVQSYVQDAPSGKLTIRCAPKLDPAGRNILLADDVLDTGLTLRDTADWFRAKGAADVRTCVLLDKVFDDPARAKLIHADWVGFRIPDRYVIGYGLDSEEAYRNLDRVCVLQN